MIIIIIRYAIVGKVYHPVVLLGSSYILLLGVGSVLFPLFRGRPLNDYTLNLIGLGFISLITGIFLVEAIGLPKSVNKQETKIRFVEIVYIFALLGLISTLLMFLRFKGIPILAANPNEAKVNFLAGNGILNLFFKGMPIFALAMLYVQFHSGKSLFLAHIYCMLIIGFILAAGYRSTTLISLGEYVFMYLILTKKKLNIPAIIITMAVAILFLAFLGSYRRGKPGFSGAVDEIDIVVNARPMMVELITRNFSTLDFFKGSLYYNDFKRFLPGTQVNANVDLKFAIFQNAEAMPEIAGVTPSIIGEAYMNFGQTGVLWVTLLTGAISGIFYVSFLKKQNFLRTTLFLTLVFGLAGGIQSGIGLKLIHLTQFWFWVIVIGVIVDKESINQHNESKQN
ncbi:MAG: oligosaccharide repeat unit polymerase [Cyclobacteriaceae bacterium]|nr:oligosaccharide repeat unit polymerase [Cyclobacteriaceae bacterium]